MDAIQSENNNPALLNDDLERILSELDHYRCQSDKLRKVNELYQKLAGITDLPTMIESYSIWLSQYVPHEIIGYHNLTNECMHMFCSCHGPERRQVINITEQLLKGDDRSSDRHAVVDGFHSHRWSFQSGSSTGILTLLRKDRKIPENEVDLINESLTILADPLTRTHVYEEIFRQARRDALTGLPNRLVFEEHIDCMIEQARRHEHPLTLAALDLDHFKTVNDTMGHIYGDEVLKRVAAALQVQIRLPDLLVRMGGDELLLVLADTDLHSARALGERLCQAVSDLDIKAGADKLGISIGLAQLEPGMSKKEWLEKADDILYQAKKAGRNQVAH